MTSQDQAFPKLNTPFVDLPSGRVSIPWYKFLIALWNRTGASGGGTTIQAGTLVDWAGSFNDLPDGFLLCDGTIYQAVNQPSLFAAIGNIWGGNGISTFAVPNLVDRVKIGAGNLYAVGSTGGVSSVTLSVANMPVHNHGVNDPGHTHIQDAHAHAQQVVNSGTAGVAGTQGASTANTTSVGTTDSTTATNEMAVTGITTANAGAGTGFSVLPPYAAVWPMIKT